MANKLNETLNTISKIKELLKQPAQSPTTLKSSDRQQVLELALDELRIIYARLDASMATAKIRSLTFLGAGLALLSYLYSSAGSDLFIPKESYGKVFYFIGLGLIISSLSLLLQALRPSAWMVPLELRLTKFLRHKTKQDLLEELAEEYIECIVTNVGRYERKVTYYVSGFFQLLCGGILLLVIKSIGG